MNLKRTRNKLLKNGYIAGVQDGRYDEWIDLLENGSAISFYHDGEKLDGALKIHGRLPDNAQFDEFYSSYSRCVKDAIMLSRV